jgi:hypothetical protein
MTILNNGEPMVGHSLTPKKKRKKGGSELFELIAKFPPPKKKHSVSPFGDFSPQTK